MSLWTWSLFLSDDTKEDILIHHSGIKSDDNRPSSNNRQQQSRKRFNLYDKEKVIFDIFRSKKINGLIYVKGRYLINFLIFRWKTINRFDKIDDDYPPSVIILKENFLCSEKSSWQEWLLNNWPNSVQTRNTANEYTNNKWFVSLASLHYC